MGNYDRDGRFLVTAIAKKVTKLAREETLYSIKLLMMGKIIILVKFRNTIYIAYK